ncbi:Desmocollin-1 [Camelus dromedarius]|uniref:Desmocollin-1 n=1 Tax=Camelus dromedarius TaxID=9838 RepID=A0A5N4CHP1_CAMDR|nr:Desmocollin-1 [Camelus dromedarius]
MAVASAAPGSIFYKQLLFCLLVLLLFCDACQKISLQVPSHLQAEALVGKVNLKKCLQSASLIQSSDPDFRILEDGSVYTTRDLTLSSAKKSFSILLSDAQRQEQKKIDIVLEARGKKIPKRHPKDAVLRRSKRRWAPIPCSLMENSLGPFPQHVQQVQSDAAQNYTIFYSISGPGVDKEPFNLFFIDKDTGDIFCTRSIDREQYAEFPLYAYATTIDGYAPEYPLPLLFKVEDDNDNAPYFESKLTMFSVPENCRTGTSVGKVTAIDHDEPDTLHTRLRYKILQQIPDHPKHFSVHPDTGVITTATPLLDREKCDTYKLIMEVRDMGGQPFGLFNTGTITISLEDENDNPPYFTESSYFTEVEENRIDVEILRMAVRDQDLPNTPHSKAVYKILQGNENGNFRISTDPNTNEAVLCVVKPLNYEASDQVVLQVGVLNEAQFSRAPNSQAPTMCTATVTVKVKDTDEGPECQPPVKVIQSKDGLPEGKELLGYKALDPEKRSSEGLRYKKIKDEGNWFEINEHTGDLKTVKTLDRESKFVKNNQYNVSVMAMDAVGRSCTGTLVVLLEDDNDHPPQIDKEVTICRHGKDFAVLEPVDADGPENGPPFQFVLVNSASKLWTLETKDGIMTTKLPRDITPSNVILGRWAILAMVLGSALLLCVLFTCFCVTAKKAVKKCFPEDVAQQNLIVSNTEGPGEEVMKVYLCGQNEEHKHSEDYVRSYNYEGKGSVAGSVGCCSDRQEDEGLEFLDHLEPKFRTLAKTCINK